MKYEGAQKLEARKLQAQNLKVIWKFDMLLFVSIHLGLPDEVHSNRPSWSVCWSVRPSVHLSLNTLETAH